MGRKNDMKPLSIWTYYINNKRKIIPLIGIIALSILGITATAAFTGAINNDIAIQFSIFEHYDTVDIPPTTSVANIKTITEEISQDKAVDQLFTGGFLSTSVTAILGSSFAYVYALEPTDRQLFMQELNWQLVNGRLPETDHEVVATETLLKVKNVAIGDRIGSDIDKQDMLPGTFTIVGALATPEPYSAAITVNSTQLVNTNGVVLFIKPNEGSEHELDTFLQTLETTYPTITVRTYSTMQAELQSEFQTLDLLLWAMNVVTILVIALSIALINIIFFMQRANEFGLLAALGYSRTRIIAKTFMESVGMVVIGWGIGVVFAELVYRIVNQLVFKQAAYGLTVFEWRTILFSLPVPIAVIMFSTVTVLWKLVRLDPVAIIEKRD